MVTTRVYFTDERRSFEPGSKLVLLTLCLGLPPKPIIKRGPYQRKGRTITTLATKDKEAASTPVEEAESEAEDDVVEVKATVKEAPKESKTGKKHGRPPGKHTGKPYAKSRTLFKSALPIILLEN
jgi:hypothetical protein